MGQTASTTEVILVYLPSSSSPPEQAAVQPEIRCAGGGAGYRYYNFQFEELARQFRQQLTQATALESRQQVLDEFLRKWYENIDDYTRHYHQEEDRRMVQERSRAGMGQDMFQAVRDQVLASYEANQAKGDAFDQDATLVFALAPFSKQLDALRRRFGEEWLGTRLMTNQAWIDALARHRRRDATLEEKWRAFYDTFRQAVRTTVSACAKVNLSAKQLESLEQNLQEWCRLREEIAAWQRPSEQELNRALETFRGALGFAGVSMLYAQVLTDLDRLLADAVLRYLDRDAPILLPQRLQYVHTQMERIHRGRLLASLTPLLQQPQPQAPYLSSLDELVKQHALVGPP